MAFDLQQERRAIEACIKQIPTASSRARLKAELENLVAQYGVTSPPESETIEARIVQLRRDAEIAAGVSLWSGFSMLFVTVATLLYFAALFLYLKGLGPERYASVEAIRPIIVFTLIVAMLGFGGLLIVRALFSDQSDDEFQKRFRHAREIFLVFAGIFGTIIGFYFGASDQDGNAPTVEVAATANRTITATVEGGYEPFIAMLTLAGDGGGTPLTGEGRTLSAQLAEEECPAQATVIVVDGRGRRAEARIEQSVEALEGFGWECPEEAEQEAVNNNSTEADNTADDVPENKQ